MKKNYLIAFLLLTSFQTLKAQKADSTSIMSLRTRNSFSDSSATAINKFAGNKAFLLHSLMHENYNTITIGHQFSNGDFIPAQGATRINDSYLQTEGKTILKDVSLWGSLSYHKVREDSTRWAHQTRNNPSAPYYYGSPANISYERTIYHFNASAERNMIGNNFPVALGIDYKIGDHYSTNDPRGSVSDFQLNLHASIGYRLSEVLKIGAGYQYGYGQERAAVNYKREEYTQNEVYPDYINYLINGYREATPKSKDRKYQNDQSRMGYRAYLTYTDNDLGEFTAIGSYLKEDQHFKFRNSVVSINEKLNDYGLSDYEFNLLWKKNIRNNNLLILLNYQNSDGTDYNYEIAANNYLYNLNSWSAKAIYSTKGKLNYNYTLGLTKSGEERQDGISGNLFGYNSLLINGSIGFVKQTVSNQSWGINVAGQYAMNLNNQLIAQTSNEKAFSKMVIFHDYLYRTASSFSGTITGDYNFPGYKKIQTGIKLSVGYTDAIGFKKLDRLARSVPGDNRFSTTISLNLYF